MQSQLSSLYSKLHRDIERQIQELSLLNLSDWVSDYDLPVNKPFITWLDEYDYYTIFSKDNQ